jgi:hypothetical protein
VEESEQCGVQGCEQPAAVLGEQPLCREHYFSNCMSRPEACAQLLKETPLPDANTESVRRFISECAKGTNDLMKIAHTFDPPDQTERLTIVFWARELSRRL